MASLPGSKPTLLNFAKSGGLSFLDLVEDAPGNKRPGAAFHFRRVPFGHKTFLLTVVHPGVPLHNHAEWQQRTGYFRRPYRRWKGLVELKIHHVHTCAESHRMPVTREVGIRRRNFVKTLVTACCQNSCFGFKYLKTTGSHIDAYCTNDRVPHC